MVCLNRSHASTPPKNAPSMKEVWADHSAKWDVWITKLEEELKGNEYKKSAPALLKAQLDYIKSL